MKIVEIFRQNLEREIKEVIKVDDADLVKVADELREYVVTNNIHEAFVELLEHYQDSINKPSEFVNAWISGFFGSGKSSFAKVFGYILGNPNLGGTAAADLFTAKLPTKQVKALLNTIHTRVPTMTVFVDLSASRNVAREGEAIVLPLYRELLTQLDYARNRELAELEITLEADDRLEAFIEAFAQATDGLHWRDRRDKALTLSYASRALHVLDPATFPAADSYLKTRPEVEVTNNWFAKRALELLERRRPEFRRLVFVVDEVSQYVSHSVQRMLDLQGLAQAFQKENGRLWMIATGQETLEDVVSALGDKRVEIARVRDRFPLNVDLVPSDLEEVVSKRVLEKNERGTQSVRAIYDRYQNQLRSNVTLNSPTRAEEFTGEEFIRVYPLLPYQIQLFIDAVSGLRAHGGAGPMVGGSNRTLIRLAHQLIKTTLSDREVGALTTVPMAYDLMDEMIPTTWRGEIDQVIGRYGNSSATEVVKTIALTSTVRALKLDVHNIAVLIHPAADGETCEPEVVEALDKLVNDETLREGEDGYRLQSPEERDWEKRRSSRGLKTGDFNRMLREKHLGEILRGLTAAVGNAHKRHFKVEVWYDDHKIINGDVTLRIYEGDDDQVRRAVERSRESAYENDAFFVFSRSDKTWRYAEQAFLSQEIIKDAEARTLKTGETELLHEERKRSDRCIRQFQRSLEEDLRSGTTVFRGNISTLDGRDFRTALAATLQEHIAEIYTHLDEFTAPVKRSDAASMIRAIDLSGQPEYLGPDGLRVIKIEADGPRIDEAGPCEQLLSLIRERIEYGSEPTGKYLESHFQRPPFGAELDVIMVVAAAAVRAGLLTVGHSGSWLRSRTDARLEQVFSAIPKFRAAVFRTREELDVKIRTRVAKLLHEDLVGDRPGLATEELAVFARERLEEDREKADSVADTLKGLGLDVPDLVDRARRVLSRMRNEDDETLVRSLDAGRADLKDGIRGARSLHALLMDDERLATLRLAHNVFAQSGIVLSDEGRQALELGRGILRSCMYVDRFAELRAAVEVIQSEREAAWEAARDQLHTVIAEVREQATPLLEQLTEAQHAEFTQRLAVATVPPEASPESGPSLETLRARVIELPGLIDELRAQIGRSHGKSVRRVAVRELFREPVRNEDELEGLLGRIREVAEEAIKDGEYFLLT